MGQPMWSIIGRRYKNEEEFTEDMKWLLEKGYKLVEKSYIYDAWDNEIYAQFRKRVK